MLEDLKKDNFQFDLWGKAVLVLIFLVVTPLALATSIFSLVALANSTYHESSQIPVLPPSQPAQSGVQVYASYPTDLPSVSDSVKTSDARVEYLRQYLDYFSSPLAPFAAYLVETSDRYTLDYRLLVAIAQKESGLCKVIPQGSFNCWGWGIHSQGTLYFDSFEAAIETVSRGLKENYIDKGYVSLEEIMSKYTPLSVGTWAEGVGRYMDDIEN